MKKLALMALAAVVATSPAWAIKGTIKTDKDTKSGDITWKAGSKKYEVVLKNNVTTEYPLADVVGLDIPKPANFDQCVQSKNIAGLKKIVEDYRMLVWDKPAGNALVKAYLTVSPAKPQEAYETARKIIADDQSAAYKGDLAPAYWSALLRLNRRSALEKNMKTALKGGDRFSRGAALLMTGDIIMKDGKESADACKKALTDGYLRVVYLYTEEGVAERLRPEALYKAAVCFSTLRQSGRADVMRTELKALYASSPWASK